MTERIMTVTTAQMPSSVKSRYVHVNVLDVDRDYVTANQPAARETKHVHVIYRSAPVPANGETARSGYQKALATAREYIGL